MKKISKAENAIAIYRDYQKNACFNARNNCVED